MSSNKKESEGKIETADDLFRAIFPTEPLPSSKEGGDKKGKTDDTIDEAKKPMVSREPQPNDLPHEIWPYRYSKGLMSQLYEKMASKPSEAALFSSRERAGFFGLQSEAAKLLIHALSSHGCDFDYNRHVSVEKSTDVKVTSSYDPIYNQIVLSHHLADQGTPEEMELSVVNELIHMFDRCRAKTDFTDLKHLACTHIRAANLVQCAPKESWFARGKTGQVDCKQYDDRHELCVKQKAFEEMLALRPHVLPKYIEQAIHDVFPKCYHDLEPFGRRMRMSSNDPHTTYVTRWKYGYDAFPDNYAEVDHAQSKSATS